MPNTAAWVDTGFLVALFARDDEHFASAVEFLANAQRLELHPLWPAMFPCPRNSWCEPED